ncbi:hypothetical protein BD560DRAFT_429550 [Blakeslea trispora]|nr:hypothetical protein BD560DRAFT_429550 [Blakeslea trispora]
MKVDNVLVSLLNDYFLMKPNGSLKHAEFTSDLLEINPMNDKMESRGKVISKSWEFYSKKDAIIVNIISVERINSSYISTALWMIKGSLKSIIFFESFPHLVVITQKLKIGSLTFGCINLIAYASFSSLLACHLFLMKYLS